MCSVYFKKVSLLYSYFVFPHAVYALLKCFLANFPFCSATNVTFAEYTATMHRAKRAVYIQGSCTSVSAPISDIVEMDYEVSLCKLRIAKSG